MYRQYMDSPLGLIEIKASAKGVTQVIFCGEQTALDHPVDVIGNEMTERCKQQLFEYFNGSRTTFHLPLDQYGTVFQQSIWDCLTRIPFGNTRSYGDIANMINNPKSVRAVGGANGRNPISIIVPCHRVIGANGTLTGYAGGIARKLWLLRHEGIAIKTAKETGKSDLKDIIHTRQSKTQFLK